MVLAYHLILTGYGHWLPNDPRGSMSTAVVSPELAKLAELHFGRKYPQPPLPELRAFYRQAVPLLKHPVLWFDERERDVLVQATGELVSNLRLTCYAGAILHNHAHFLIRKHRLKGEDMVQALKTELGNALKQASLAPPDHPIFSEDLCVLYKSDKPAMQNCIAYINANFRKHRLPSVIYDFVRPYDNWPPGAP